MAVTLDAVGPSTTAQSGTNASSISWSHTVGTGATVLIVTAALGRIPDSVNMGATYNGVAMTQLAKTHTNNSIAGYLQTWYLLAPTAGTHTVQVSAAFGTSVDSLVGCSFSLFGTASQSPQANVQTGAGSSPTTQPITGRPVTLRVYAAGNTFSAESSLSWESSVLGYSQKNVTNADAAGNLAAALTTNTDFNLAWPLTTGDYWATHTVSFDEAAGQPSAGAPVTQSLSITTGATFGVSRGSTSAITVGVSAHGLLGYVGEASPEVTVAIESDGSLHDMTGDRSVAVSVTASGNVGNSPASGPVAPTVAIAADGQVVAGALAPVDVSVSITLGGTLVRHIRFFSPPTHEEPIRTREPWIFRFRLPQASSVIRKNGTFVLKRGVSQDELTAAGENGVDYFIGGYGYVVSDDIAAELEAAGFDVEDLA